MIKVYKMFIYGLSPKNITSLMSRKIKRPKYKVFQTNLKFKPIHEAADYELRMKYPYDFYRLLPKRPCTLV